MSAEEPLFRVVRGVPTAEELAALVGAIIVRTRPATAPVPAPTSAWARSGRPGNSRGWRAAGLPR
ncbi:acyl-CoA carboxylase subunit epsilon [Micromonospora vinacea]|jgi:Acyl-CoA carboxylase epsilon subunit|uniref:acyl-CoA carboxylase subunit epsilon n=1 Tax=Micromonospora vinacea TaxID=709878 RepID=UPI003D8BA3E9